jgi:hypothetical protein
MKTTLKILLLALALVTLAACGKKEEGKPAAAAPVAVAVPANAGDNQAWKAYIMSVVKQNMQGIRTSPYTYYLPDTSASDFEDQYDRQLDNVTGVVGRGVLPGNMLAFGSPASARMADLIVESFTDIPAGSMKDVRVLFIGQAVDSDRAKAAIEPSGANYVFVEAK